MEEYYPDFINKRITLTNPEAKETCCCSIKDSGERITFESGATRDIKIGKGRCDLMPIGVISTLLDDPYLALINLYLETRDVTVLYSCVEQFCIFIYGDKFTGILEVSKHYEDGAIKYGEHNWEKGIPLHSFFDSAIRHKIKMSRGDDDEPHDRAFLWNILGAIWTIEHKEELIDI